MYCTVALSFQSERKPIKKVLTYKVGEHNVKVNDVVEVSFRNKLRYGVVSGVYSEDTYNPKEMYRLEIERVLHTNTVYAAVRRRFNMFKGLENSTRKSNMREFESLQKQYGDDYLCKIMKHVCLGNMVEENDGTITIWHADQRLTFVKTKGGKLVLVLRETHKQFKTAWRTSLKAQNYFNKLFEEYYGNS